MNGDIDNNYLDENDYTLTEIFYVLKKHKNKVLLAFISVLFISFIYTLLAKPVFESSSVIMVGEEQDSMSILEMGFGQDRNYIENEIQILNSRTTSDLAISNLIENGYLDSLYLFGTKKYEFNYFRKILTFGLLDNNESNLSRNYLDQTIFNKFSNSLRNSISISNNRNTDAITISVKSYDPDESALLANTLVEVYKKRDLEWVTGEMSHLKVFLIEQLEKKEIELNNIEQELKLFQEKEKIFGLDENSSLLLQNLTLFETEYNNTLAALSIVTEKEKYINNKLTEDEQELSKKVSNTINVRLYAMQSELAQLESELVSTITKYGNQHFAVKEIESKLNKLKNNIENETRKLISNGISSANPIVFRQSLMDSSINLQSIKSQLVSKSNAYKKLVVQYEKKLSLLPEKVLEFTRLERLRSIQAETYSFMSTKLEEARIGEASKIGKIRIIDTAIPDLNSVYPNFLLNLLVGAILGMFLGISIVGIIEYFDNTIKSIEQIERRGLSILSIIPAIGIDKRRKKDKRYLKDNANIEKLQRRLITHEDPKSPISEAYRSLRTSLMYTEKEQQGQIILVSSPGPGEGKTTTIANLAITYANLGKKTLLIDSDLRKPVLNNVFKFDKSPGLTSYLSGNAKINEISNKTDIDNLHVITSGVIPPNPSELLDSGNMKKFIDEMRNIYDIVLFDSPPLIAVTDAYVLMKYIDQFLLVVRAGVTEKGGMQRVLTAIRQSDLPITGVVINAMTEEYSYGAGYYYNYYQYYYGDSEK
tara:strand:+ start:3284 stop:5575 length:2292 start_codon:yes stop_codon:yes gene_type:complete